MTEYAFPHEEWINSTDTNLVNPVMHKGMTLRDYFAAKAMQGMFEFDSIDGKTVTFNDIAKMSYELANAMLTEREK